METLTPGRIKIAYEASGSGEAGVVILIRGQGTQLIHWPESFYEAFSTRGFLTIRFDNRDTGLSSKFDSTAGRQLESLRQRLAAGEDIDPPYTLDDMAQDVAALMDELAIEAAHILGISMGGFIAQLLAAKYPARVLSMTSVMSGSGNVDPTLIDSLWSVPRSREAYIGEWVEDIRRFGSKPYFEGDDYSRRTAAAAFDRCYSPDGAGRETARLIPGATFQLIEGMGHDIPPRLGKQLAEIVLRHILLNANRVAQP
jgi:pimeloyl-ACP methyl ester carboxylesterase